MNTRPQRGEILPAPKVTAVFGADAASRMVRATKTNSILESDCQCLVKQRFCWNRPNGPVGGRVSESETACPQSQSQRSIAVQPDHIATRS